MGKDRGCLRMDNGNLKRVTIFAGHYGSGKTNIAVNYALKIAAHGKRVAIADLDIVNPYFRTKDSEKVLEEKNVRLISSPYANTNVDTPALPAEAYSVIHDTSVFSVVDVGGDDRGALALGRYAGEIKAQGNYEMLFVINKYRYLTADAAATLEIMNEIETAAGIKFTGIVNNSNLGEETTADDVLNSAAYADEVSKLSGLEVKMTTVRADIEPQLKGKIENLMPIDIYIKQSWLR